MFSQHLYGGVRLNKWDLLEDLKHPDPQRKDWMHDACRMCMLDYNI